MTANELREKLFMVEDQSMNIAELRVLLFELEYQDAEVDFREINSQRSRQKQERESRNARFRLFEEGNLP